ncbi:MAG: hypothetical protein AAB223_00995, partial [Pseudomonadota bacterium]
MKLHETAPKKRDFIIKAHHFSSFLIIFRPDRVGEFRLSAASGQRPEKNSKPTARPDQGRASFISSLVQ